MSSIYTFVWGKELQNIERAIYPGPLVITQTWVNGNALSLGFEQDSLNYPCDKNLKTHTYTLIVFD